MDDHYANGNDTDEKEKNEQQKFSVWTSAAGKKFLIFEIFDIALEKIIIEFLYFLGFKFQGLLNLCNLYVSNPNSNSLYVFSDEEKCEAIRYFIRKLDDNKYSLLNIIDAAFKILMPIYQYNDPNIRALPEIKLIEYILQNMAVNLDAGSLIVSCDQLNSELSFFRNLMKEYWKKNPFKLPINRINALSMFAPSSLILSSTLGFLSDENIGKHEILSFEQKVWKLMYKILSSHKNRSIIYWNLVWPTRKSFCRVSSYSLLFNIIENSLNHSIGSSLIRLILSTPDSNKNLNPSDIFTLLSYYLPADHCHLFSNLIPDVIYPRILYESREVHSTENLIRNLTIIIFDSYVKFNKISISKNIFSLIESLLSNNYIRSPEPQDKLCHLSIERFHELCTNYSSIITRYEERLNILISLGTLIYLPRPITPNLTPKSINFNYNNNTELYYHHSLWNVGFKDQNIESNSDSLPLDHDCLDQLKLDKQVNNGNLNIESFENDSNNIVYNQANNNDFSRIDFDDSLDKTQHVLMNYRKNSENKTDEKCEPDLSIKIGVDDSKNNNLDSKAFETNALFELVGIKEELIDSKCNYSLTEAGKRPIIGMVIDSAFRKHKWKLGDSMFIEFLQDGKSRTGGGISRSTVQSTFKSAHMEQNTCLTSYIIGGSFNVPITRHLLGIWIPDNNSGYGCAIDHVSSSIYTMKSSRFSDPQSYRFYSTAEKSAIDPGTAGIYQMYWSKNKLYFRFQSKKIGFGTLPLPTEPTNIIMFILLEFNHSKAVRFAINSSKPKNSNNMFQLYSQLIPSSYEPGIIFRPPFWQWDHMNIERLTSFIDLIGSDCFKQLKNKNYSSKPAISNVLGNFNTPQNMQNKTRLPHANSEKNGHQSSDVNFGDHMWKKKNLKSNVGNSTDPFEKIPFNAKPESESNKNLIIDSGFAVIPQKRGRGRPRKDQYSTQRTVDFDMIMCQKRLLISKQIWSDMLTIENPSPLICPLCRFPLSSPQSSVEPSSFSNYSHKIAEDYTDSSKVTRSQRKKLRSLYEKSFFEL